MGKEIVFPATLAGVDTDSSNESENGESDESGDELEITDDDEYSLKQIFESSMCRINQNRLPQGSAERKQFVMTEFGNKNLLSMVEDKSTAFHYAVQHKSSEVVQLLIDEARLSSSSSSSSSANDDHQSISLESLLRQADMLSYTALHKAVENGDLEISKLLAEADPNDKHILNFRGETPIYTAVRLGHIEIVKMIGETCTVPAFDGPDGTTALHAAITNLPEAHTRGSSMVKVILEAGKRQFPTSKQSRSFKDFIRQADDSCNTALTLAVRGNHLGVVKQILKADHSYKHSDKALYTATELRYKDIIAELCKHRTSSSDHALGPRKQTALHAAISSRDKAAAQKLELKATMDWFMRPRNEMHVYSPNECPDYEEYPSLFTIKLYHGGQFEDLNSKFVNYKIDYFDCCNVDLMSIFEVGAMVSEAVGRKSVGMELYFKSPKEGMDEIGKLETDGDILLMTNLITKEVQYVEVFAVLMEPIAVEGLPLLTPNKNAPVINLDDCNIEEVMQNDDSSSTHMEQEPPKKKRIKKVGKKPTPTKKSTKRPILDEASVEGDETEANIEGHGTEGNVENEDTGYEAEHEYEANEVENEVHGEEAVNEEQAWMDGSDEDKDDEEWFPDSSNDGNSNYDEDFGDISSEYKGFPGYMDDILDKADIELNDEVIGGSEDEHMAVSSEDELDPIFPEFNEEVDMVDPNFELGMLFSSAEVLRMAVRSHAIAQRRPIKRQPNMGSKVQFKCTPPCTWKLYANKCQRSGSYQIRTYLGKHTCQLTFHQKQISAEWIARRYIDDIRMNPQWEGEAFQKKVVNDLGCNVNKSMCYRAKHIALKVINGTHEESFAQIWDYGNEVKRVMPDTTLAIELEDPEPDQDRGRFKRIYICLGPVKRGFKAGCRPVVGLDGCHLKGPYGGQLLTAVGMDPEDGMYPIAWSVVDAENTENWCWFLSKLKDDLNMTNDGAWTFISDKQKGLINALEELCPNAEHRFCVMHLYNNMHKEHKGAGLRTLLWSAAKSTTLYHYERNMAAMKKLSKHCWQWLNAKPREQWSRSGFRTNCKSDLFVNNHCEVFNASIRKVRHLPIVALLRCIHIAVMRRIQRRMAEAQDWQGEFCPNSLKRLEEANKKSVGCHVTWSGGPRYLVQTSAGGYELVVDLIAKTCACKKWQLCGIPCFHAVACMNLHDFNLQDFIHRCYSVNMFKKVYRHFVEPINGKEEWEKTFYTEPLPPIVKPSTGRPKLKRSRKNDVPAPPNPDDSKLKRHKTSVQCGRCKLWGHNRRTCPKDTNDVVTKANTEGANDANTEGTNDANNQAEDNQGGDKEVQVDQGGAKKVQVDQAGAKKVQVDQAGAAVLRARSSREKKINKKYVD